MTSAESSDATFDDVLVRLESTIAKLADGTAPLEELVAAHQRAAGLLAEAEKRLEALKANADRLAASVQSASPTPAVLQARKG